MATYKAMVTITADTLELAEKIRDDINKTAASCGPLCSSEGRDAEIRTLAMKLLRFNDDFEMDGDALTSEGDDNGAWVQTWSWVSFAGTPLDKDEENEDVLS